MSKVAVYAGDLEITIQFLKQLRGTDGLITRFQHALAEYTPRPMTTEESLALVMEAMRYVTGHMLGAGSFDRHMAEAQKGVGRERS